jgi:hypothetical protein
MLHHVKAQKPFGQSTIISLAAHASARSVMVRQTELAQALKIAQPGDHQPTIANQCISVHMTGSN